MFSYGWWLYLTVSLFLGALQCQNCSYKDINLTYPATSVRPVKNWTTPTEIFAAYYLVSIVGLDMSMQTITTVGFFIMYWENEFISWNNTLYCGIKYLYVTRSKLWQPDLYIYERVENDDKSQINPFLRVHSSGIISDLRSLRIVSASKFNIFTFPFDTQVFNISFGSYIYTVADIQMSSPLSSSEALDWINENFMTKGDWEVINVTIHNSDYSLGSDYDRVIYQYTIKRVSEFYLLTFVIPVYFMVVLDMISMFIQMDKADRLGFKITLVLGFAMLLLILNDILPLSDTPPLLGIFCCVCMAAMLCSIVGSIGTTYILNLYKEDGNVPHWVNSILIARLSSLLCVKRTVPRSADSVENGDKKRKINFELVEMNESIERRLDIPLEVKLLKRLLLAILKIRKSMIDRKKRNIAKSQCSLAANVVDRLILIVYTVIMTVLSIYVIVIWASVSSQTLAK